MTLRERARLVIVWTFFASLVYGVLCTFSLSLERAFGAGAAVGTVAGGAVAAAMLVFTVRWHSTVARLIRSMLDRAGRISDRDWILAWIGIGWLVRIGWLVAVPQLPTSDYRSYLRLAVSLVERGEYWIGHTCFFRPPGMSLALAPLIAAFGARPWVPWLLNLVLFALTVIVVFRLARRVADPRAARITVVLLAVWPNSVFLTGFASKELLLLPLLSAVTLLYLRASEDWSSRASIWRCAAAGVLTGACVLTQPTAAVLPGVFLLYEVVRGAALPGVAGRLALVMAAAALVVSPWTVRNYRASGELVPVSANGGHSLWVGNNPEATGGYLPIRGRYAELGEIEYNRRAYRWALDWIRANPRRFLELAARKQVLYLGDDADGAYTALKRGLGIGDLRYAAAKGMSNGFWIGVLALAAISIWRHRSSPVLASPAVVLLTAPMLAQLAVFSVTESGGRHHVPIMGLLVVLASLLVLSDDGQRGPEE